VTGLQHAAIRSLLDDGEPGWAAMSARERVMCLELLGYTVLPAAAETAELERCGAELARLPLDTASYSPHQRYAHNVQWRVSANVQRLIALPAVLDFLSALFGDELVCTGCTYAITEPGYPGMAVHTDSQPYGSKIFGMQASAPRLVRVLLYLDQTTNERAPLMVVPCSHVSMHVHAQPYRRYRRHPDLRPVVCPAGSAVVIDQRVFHCVGPNVSDRARRVFAVGYRPAWAGPIAEVPELDPGDLERLAPEVRALFRSPNFRSIDFDAPNRPSDMPDDAFGLGLERWGANRHGRFS
jgi:Phytanoyl-CoA dioxygenase (PhyH)